MDKITLRNFKAADIDEVVDLFRNTIHTINAADYTKEQLDAWAPEKIDNQRWCGKLLEHFTIVAQKDDVICGFGDLHNNGYFDHLFVHKDFQGLGIASKIVSEIEKQAKVIGVSVIEVHVSITAKTFFLKKGYIIEKYQEVTYNGQTFVNYVMKKVLK